MSEQICDISQGSITIDESSIQCNGENQTPVRTIVVTGTSETNNIIVQNANVVIRLQDISIKANSTFYVMIRLFL
jgi:hypothetical protein